jgi:hypothetical protein
VAGVVWLEQHVAHRALDHAAAAVRRHTQEPLSFVYCGPSEKRREIFRCSLTLGRSHPPRGPDLADWLAHPRA